MKILRNNPLPKGPSFFKVAPGKDAMPLGHIRLHITFGEMNIFYKESLIFEVVVDFLVTYYALFGLPCFTKFMFYPTTPT